MKKIAYYVQFADRIRKRALLIAVMLLVSCIFLTGCGGQEDKTGYEDKAGYEDKSSYEDILTKTEQLPDLTKNVDKSEMISYDYLGSQFYQGEKIQLWGERHLDGCKAYLHREDGSRELLAENISLYDMSIGGWRIDEQKRIFYEKDNTITRIDENGKKVFTADLNDNELIMLSCHLPDGRIIASIPTGAFSTKLSEIDPDSGKVTDLVVLPLYTAPIMLAPNGDGLMLLDTKGLWDVDLTEGTLNSIISFDGTTYSLKLDNRSTDKYLVKEDIRLVEDDKAEILWSDGTSEILHPTRIEDKEILVMRFIFTDSMVASWMKEQVVKFNRGSEVYYITLDEFNYKEDDWTEFQQKTGILLATGKGADIICYSAVADPCSLMEKGAFADLTPFMQSSGVREEDYFPAAFSGWKNDGKIYGLNCMVHLEGMWVDKAIVGDSRITDIEELVDCLLDYDGDVMVYYTYAAGVLIDLLENSDSLCGMVDFENGTCDFSGELFEKMLETAKKYGWEEGKQSFLRAFGNAKYRNFFAFPDSRYWGSLGKVLVGYPFDDGMHTRARADAMLAINADSANQEGAWEFLNFLLSEEVQSSFAVDDSPTEYTSWRNFPVSKKVFDTLCNEHRTFNNGYDIEVNDGSDQEFKDMLITGLTKEREAELRAALENARSAPVRIQPLLQIVVEEAYAYFAGDKSIDQVRDLIQNRVQLYLDERK